MNNKKDFYIFLDFDGVFNYFKWVLYAQNNDLYEENSLYICPDNMVVFNRILNEVRLNNFLPKIVISSDRRFAQMEELIEQLNKFGVDYKGNYDRTSYIAAGERRGFDIIQYLNKLNIKDDFIVIDDNVEDIKYYVNK